MATKTPKIAPVPRGYRTLTPHLTVTDVQAVADFYIKAFGAKLDSDETVPGTDIVVFALLKVGNSLLSIAQGDTGVAGMISLHQYVEDAKTTFETAIEAGCVEIAPLEETYWGDLMGVVVDPFGVRWSIAQRVARLTAEEREERARAAFGCEEVAAEQDVVSETAEQLADV